MYDRGYDNGNQMAPPPPQVPRVMLAQQASRLPPSEPPIWPSRSSQLSQLQSALRHSHAPIFAWGGPSTGKLSTIDAALSAHPAPTRTHKVDCVLEYGDTALFRALVPPGAPRPADASAAALVSALDACGEEADAPVLALVLLRAERLCAPHFRPDALRVVLALPQLVRRPERLRVVFCSRVAWPALRDRFDLNVWEPRCVYFAPYSEEEVVEGMMATAKKAGGVAGDRLRLGNDSYAGNNLFVSSELANKLFPAYVVATVRVLFPVTKDLKELGRTCFALYPQYVDPLVKDPKVQKNSLWSRFSPVIGEARGMLYHRELVLPKANVSGGGGVGQSGAGGSGDGDGTGDGNDNADGDLVPEVTQDRDRRCQSLASSNDARRRTGGETEMMESLLRLGRIPRLLLLATYLGMVNPPKYDLHYFSLQTVRKRRPRQHLRGGVSKSREKAKARAVPLNRIIALFDAIQGRGIDAGAGNDAKSALSTTALVSLASLQSLALVTRERATAVDISGDAKFRCDISDETANELAKSLNIPLREFVHVDSRELPSSRHA